jgi:hypothetical protein
VSDPQSQEIAKRVALDPDAGLRERWLVTRFRGGAELLPSCRLRLLAHVDVDLARDLLASRLEAAPPRLRAQALRSRVTLLSGWGRAPRVLGALAVVRASWERQQRPLPDLVQPLLDVAERCAQLDDLVGHPLGDACAEAAHALAARAQGLSDDQADARCLLWAVVRVAFAALYLGYASVDSAGRAVTLAARAVHGRGKLLYLTAAVRDRVARWEALAAPGPLVREDVARSRPLVLRHELVSSRRRNHPAPGYACPHAVRGRASVSVHLWLRPKVVRALGRRVRSCCLKDPASHARARFWADLRCALERHEARGLHPRTVARLLEQVQEAVAAPTGEQERAYEAAQQSLPEPLGLRLPTLLALEEG